MSLAATTTLTCSNNTDANFRLWGGGVAAKFASAGLVQTADTGQINWATVLTPGAANTVMGYEIWRFADAMQATSPVFFKIEYGSYSGVAANPGMWITFGSGSNGTGTLTGVLSTRQQFGATVSYTTNVLSCYWSGDTNRFVAAMFAAGTGVSTSSLLVFGFERTLDAAGAVSSEGVLITVRTSASAWAQVHWNCTTGQTSVWETTIGCMGPQQGTGASGTQIAVYPIFHTKGVYLNPGVNIFGYFNADITAGSPVSFVVYGASHTFMPIGNTVTGAFMVRGTTTSMMVRYD